MRYKAIVSYDGSMFNGFQRLNDLRTVQQELEKAISIVNKSDVTIKGASRTDKGVHAKGQVIHFDLDVDVPVDRLKKAINKILPSDIRIMSINVVSNDFHARHSAFGKRYIYKIYTGEYDVFLDRYYTQYDYPIDIDKMKKASNIFIGMHDFRNFTAGERDNYLSSITKIIIRKSGNFIQIEFIGKSFYRYMVRNIVNALLLVSRDKMSMEEVKSLLDGEIDKPMTPASPNGLYLEEVLYYD